MEAKASGLPPGGRLQYRSNLPLRVWSSDKLKGHIKLTVCAISGHSSPADVSWSVYFSEQLGFTQLIDDETPQLTAENTLVGCKLKPQFNRLIIFEPIMSPAQNGGSCLWDTCAIWMNILHIFKAQTCQIIYI